MEVKISIKNFLIVELREPLTCKGKCESLKGNLERPLYQMTLKFSFLEEHLQQVMRLHVTKFGSDG